MSDLKVIEYIRSETAKGVSRDEIIKNLTQSGWTSDDIQSHFLLVEQNQNNVPLTPIQDTQSNNAQNQPKKKINIFGTNLLIFAGYYLLAIILSKLISIVDISVVDIGIMLIFFGYMIHAIILVLLSIAEGIRGISQKVKTGAAQYFLTAILLLIIGFGACTLAFTSEMVGFNL